VTEGPLAGIRVLDLTRVVAGPYATGLLADFGARVVKLEPPGRGDECRGLPDQVRGLSLTFSDLNRNKESVTLDLRTEKGREVLLALLPHFDVLVENFRAGTLDVWGLTWERLAAAHPRLVYASLSGFGAIGPKAGRASYDLVAQAESGIMAMTGLPGGDPLKTGTNLADYVGGVFLAFAMLAALRARDATGKPQRVDLSNQDVLTTMLDAAPAWQRASGQEPARNGNFHRRAAPYGVFRAKDGWIAVAAGNPNLFKRSLQAIGRAELLDDREFRNRVRRGEHVEQITALWSDFVAARTRAEVTEVCERHRLAYGEVQSIADLGRDPQLAARGQHAEIDHPDGQGKVPTRGLPIRFVDSPGALRATSPTVGQHTDAVLRELLGLGDGELEALRKSGVV
jgi:crotonobetainyl-CoA:carnitine CoA-transferase CaiB-like acyl-CoA transferase